jgi:hypothetical protein
MAGENEGELDTLLDEGLERLFSGGPDKPEASDEPPEADAEDTPEEGPADDAEDTDSDEAKEDEGAEEEEEKDANEGDDSDEAEEKADEEAEKSDDDSDEADDEEEEEELLTVTAEERARIEKDPALKKLHRSMQGDYTRKTTAVKDRERAIEQIESDLRDPDKSADFIARIYKRQPDVAAAAFERVATGDSARDFLVAIGIQTPEVFEKAYDRVRELLDDESAMKAHKADQARAQRDQDLARREAGIRRQTFQKDYDRVSTLAAREADKVGIEPDEADDLADRLKEMIRGRVKEDGSIDLSASDVKALVKREKARIDEQYRRASERARKKLARESQDATKRKAKAAEKGGPSAPAPAGRKPTKDRTRFKAPEGADGLDAFTDHYFGGE